MLFMKPRTVACWLLFLSLYSGTACAQFYHPDKKVYGTPDQQGLKYEAVTFKSEDGTKLSGWFVPATTSPVLGTVIHYHGNAQNMTAHFSFVSWLPKEGFNVFVFDYRGYGQSAGSAKRKGIHEDSVTALNYIKSRTDIPRNKLLVFGQSLGGANAIDAVATVGIEGICGVVVDSAFYSYKDIAKDKAPGFLVDMAIGDDFSPGPLAPRLSPIPFLVIHGTSDSVVPYAHGKRLYQSAQEPKFLWTVQGAGHTEALSTYGKTYQPKLLAFFRDCLTGNVKIGGDAQTPEVRARID
jgi:fermentation-respiration switch protein FrsA (DUF1100 family)